MFRESWAVSVPRQGEGIGPAGVAEPGGCTRGFPRNLGDLLISTASRLGSADPETPRPPAGHPGPRGTKRWLQRVVLPGDDNKHGRKDGQESERPHSTVEAGTPISEGPCGGKGGVESSNRWRET